MCLRFSTVTAKRSLSTMHIIINIIYNIMKKKLDYYIRFRITLFSEIKIGIVINRYTERTNNTQAIVF